MPQPDTLKPGEPSSLSSIHAPPKPKNKIIPAKGWVHFVAGGAGGMCGAIITSPLDVVKTRLQSDLFNSSSSSSTSTCTTTTKQTKLAKPDKLDKLTKPTKPAAIPNIRRLAYHFVETGQILKEIATKEGPRALFKGLGPTLVGVVPARSINFFAYGNGKRLLADKLNNGVETPLIHLTAAACAGVATASATNPIWVVKTRLQLESHQLEQALNASRAAAVRRVNHQTTAHANFSTTTNVGLQFSLGSSQSLPKSEASVIGIVNRGKQTFFKSAPAPPRPAYNSFQMAVQIVEREGIKGLYKGMSASYLGVAEGTIQWVLYERLKRMGGAQEEQDENRSASGRSRWSSLIGAAGTAKLVASLITYPHEVIRTRLRQKPPAAEAPKYTGLLQTIKLVFREEGAAAFYSGLSAHLLRVVPNAVVMFSIYEMTLKLASSRTRADE